MANPLGMLLVQQEQIDPDDPEAILRLLGGEDGQEPQLPQAPMEQALPEAPQAVEPSQPGSSQSQWGSWLESPANRSFLLNMGLQLMSGGWGGWGSQLARAIAAGYQGAHATESGATIDARGRTQLPREPRRGLGTPRGVQPQSRPLQVRVEAERASLTELVSLLQNPNLTEQEWNQQANEGGLIHRVLGPGQSFNNKDVILAQVQQRLYNLPRRGGTVSAQELLQLGKSTAPQDLADFEILARQILGNPGVGYRWIVTPDGRFDRQQLTRGGPPGPGGNRGTLAIQAGVDQARLSINSIRDFITHPDHWGVLSRAPQQYFNTGPYAQMIDSMYDAVASYMHARSGQQTGMAERETYIRSHLPQPGDSQNRILYKLSNLELAMMLIGRRAGESISDQSLLAMYNQTRRYAGLSAVTEEQFRVLLPGLVGSRGMPQTGIPPPTDQAAPQTQTGTPPGTGTAPAPAPVVPQTQAPVAPQRPAWASEPPQNAPPRPGPNFFWRQLPSGRGGWVEVQ